MTRARFAAGHSVHSITILLTVTIVTLFTGCSNQNGNGSGGAGQRVIPAVEAVQARVGSLPLTERLSGLVKAKNQVELYPQISAAVVQVYVQNGEVVKAGDPLVRLRDTELKELLKQAQANYQIAAAQDKQAAAELERIRSELKRSTSLVDKNLISQTEFERIQTDAVAAEANAELAKARVAQAQALVDQRSEALSQTVVRSPVDGAVGNRNAEVGMVVSPNTRLFTVGQLESVRVEIVLTDRMLSYIKERQRTEILSPNLPFGSVSAPIARVSPFLHPVSHSTIAEIDVSNPDGALKPGGFVSVDVYYGESEQATLVPLSALWENPSTGTVGVYVSRDSLTGEPVSSFDGPRSGSLTEPVGFAFIPVEVVAKGRLNAGIRGIDAGRWVVTIGHELLGADSGSARVRPVSWELVEELQQLQRENLLDEVLRFQQEGKVDTSLIGDSSNHPWPEQS